MAPGGIEPTTFALLARRSNQLSYGAIVTSGNLFYFPISNFLTSQGGSITHQMPAPLQGLS